MRNSVLPPQALGDPDIPKAKIAPDSGPSDPEKDFFATTNIGVAFGETSRSKKVMKKKKKKKKVGMGSSQLGFDQTIGDFRQNGMFETLQKSK